jgi:hypothetical protein
MACRRWPHDADGIGQCVVDSLKGEGFSFLGPVDEL